MGDAAQHQMDGWIAHAGLLEALQFAHTFQRDLSTGGFGIEPQSGLKQLGLDRPARDGVQPLAQGIDLVRPDGHARSHRVSAMADEQVVAVAQRGGEIKALDAAAGATPFVALATDDDGGAVKFLEHARGDDADDADVPEQPSLNEDVVAFGLERAAQRADGFVSDGAFDLLTLAVAGVQAGRDGRGRGGVARKQEAEGFLGGFESTGGVQAGRKLEADFIAADAAANPGDFLQGQQSRTLRRVEAFESSGDEDAVLARERDEVSDGAERDQVEKRAQVE